MPGCMGFMNVEKGKTRHYVSKRWRWNKQNCRNVDKLFHNTIFDHNYFSISQILELIYAYCENDSIAETTNKLGISKNSIRAFYEKINEL